MNMLCEETDMNPKTNPAEPHANRHNDHSVWFRNNGCSWHPLRTILCGQTQWYTITMTNNACAQCCQNEALHNDLIKSAQLASFYLGAALTRARFCAVLYTVSSERNRSSCRQDSRQVLTASSPIAFRHCWHIGQSCAKSSATSS